MIRPLLILGLVMHSVVAQESTDREAMLAARRETALAKPVFKANPWNVDLATAQQESLRTGKPIFAYFTRSYSP
jgi:hypothetical protein